MRVSATLPSGPASSEAATVRDGAPEASRAAPTGVLAALRGCGPLDPAEAPSWRSGRPTTVGVAFTGVEAVPCGTVDSPAEALTGPDGNVFIKPASYLEARCQVTFNGRPVAQLERIRWAPGIVDGKWMPRRVEYRLVRPGNRWLLADQSAPLIQALILDVSAKGLGECAHEVV